VTGYGQASDRQRTEAAGFHAHVVKPVDMHELVTLLDGLLIARP
jgi:CheY-like chemotaxis protein